MKIKKNAMIIAGIVLVLSLAMNLVDGVIKPGYLVKSLIKIVLFAGVPLLYFIGCPAERNALKGLLHVQKRQLLGSALLGAGCFAVILGAYFLLRGSFDFSGITKSLTGDVGVTAENFPLVALYISFANSFLEEFFFRFFAFLTLKRHAGRAFAYVFSALMFALYHVGMTLGWLHPALFLLALLGLMAGGVIFNLLDEKCGSILPSWLTHMGCNFGINTIGLVLFGMI